MVRKAFFLLQLGAVVPPPEGHAMNNVPSGWKNGSQFAPFVMCGCAVYGPVGASAVSAAPVSTVPAPPVVHGPFFAPRGVVPLLHRVQLPPFA